MGRWSTGNCARSLKLTIRTNSTCITQNPSWKMRNTNFSGILRYKRITRPSDCQQKRKKKEQKKKNEKKKANRVVDFAVPADRRVKLKQSEKRDKYLDLTRELKKVMAHENDSDANCNWCARYSHQRIGKGSGRLRKKRMSRYHSNYNIVKID